MQLWSDAGPEARPLKMPILVVLFRVFGVLSLLGAALAAFGAVRMPPSAGNLPSAAVVAASGVLSSLVSFGIAQVILLVAKIEYNTAAQKDAAILQSLHKLEASLQPVVAAKVKSEA